MSTVELIPIDEAFNKIDQIVASGNLDELLDLAPVGAAPEDIVTVLWSGPIDTHEQADGAVTAIQSADVLDYCCGKHQGLSLFAHFGLSCRVGFPCGVILVLSLTTLRADLAAAK